MLTPAWRATLFVLRWSYPSRARTRAVASSRASTVAEDRSCWGFFLGVVRGIEGTDGASGMRVYKMSDRSHIGKRRSSDVDARFSREGPGRQGPEARSCSRRASPAGLRDHRAGSEPARQGVRA